MFKKTLLAVLIPLAALIPASANAEGWFGFMNVFDNANGSPGGYQFGSPWGVSDMQTTVVVSNVGTYIGDQLRLEPNFNTYLNAINSGDPGEIAYWTDGAGGGNKFMEANTYVEFSDISLLSASFEGAVDEYSFDSAYEALAFIKVLNPDAGWSLDVFETYDLALGGAFSLTADLADHQGKVLQYGFMVSGLNANPDNDFGSALVTVIPEPSTYAAIVGGLFLLAAFLFRRRRIA